MKSLILALALVPSLASAETLLEANAYPVGIIELSDEGSEYCDADHPLSATVTDPDELVSPACYTLTNSKVEVKWYDGVIARYPINLFKRNRKA